MKSSKKTIKSIALSLVAALLVTSTPAITAQAEPAAVREAITQADFLKADGKNLRNNSGTGDIVNLRGTNAGGYLLQEMWMTPTFGDGNVNDETEIYEILTERFGEEKMWEIVNLYQDSYWTEADFDNCANLGMNVIRLPFWWRNLVDEDGNFYGVDPESVSGSDGKDAIYDTAFERMDWFVSEAAERGMYVIIDFHGAPGSQNGSDHSGVDGGAKTSDKEAASEFFFGENAAANQELYYDMWEVIAERYEGNPAVAGYDLLNEPTCTWRYESKLYANETELLEDLWGIYDIAYDRIREVDADHVIIMEATWNPSDLPNPVAYGWDNVMYEYHNYLYDSYTDPEAQVNSMQNKLSSIANTDYNVPSYMGEFSFFDLPESWDLGLELLNESGINYTTWTYKTVSSYGMWGLYHHDVTTKINLETASEEEIRAHYARMGEASINSALADVAIKYFGAETVENTLEPTYFELEDGTYYFVANSSQKVLTVQETNYDALGATGVSVSTGDATQAFELINNDDGTVSLRSLSNRHYVEVWDDGILRASGDGIYDETKFWMLACSATQVGLKSVSNTLFACADEDLEETYGYTPIIANRSSTTGWEMFQIYDAEGNMIGGEPLALHSGWTRYEAEDTDVATIVGGGTESHDFYSEGTAASGLNCDIAIADVAADFSNVKYVEFDVDAPVAGDYKMVISYNGDDDKAIAIQANGGEFEIVDVPRLSGGTWDLMHEIVVYVTLEEGDNTVRVSGTLGGQGWMNIDCVDIVDYPIVNNQGTERLEGEYYYFTANLDKQPHYSGGAGVGGLNSDTPVENVAPNFANIKYVNFSIYAEEAGEYRITWGYTGANQTDMVAMYKVNDNAPQAININNDGGDWNIPGTLDFTINLNKGFNTLLLSGTLVTTDHYMNIDYIDVRNMALGEIELAPTGESGWTRYEAEDLERNGGALEAGDFLSSGKGVGSLNTPDIAFADVADDMSNVNYVELTVDAAVAGDYRLVFGYNGNDDKIGAVKVNNGAVQEISLPHVDGGQWNTMYEKYIELPLVVGTNTIKISGAVGSGWYNIDYIDLCDAPIFVVDTKTATERYEAEYFDYKSVNNPAIEAQGMYSGPEKLGIGGMGANVSSFVVGDNILESRLPWTNFTVWADEAGTYIITLGSNGAGANVEAVYQVNNNPSQAYTIANLGHGWDYMVKTSLEVELNAGYNSIVMNGSNDANWMNFDYLDVAPKCAHSHYTGTETKAATTTQKGEMTYVCDDGCGGYYTEATDILPVKVAFNAQGGTACATVEKAAGDAYLTLPTTTKTGYTFAGWYTAATGGTKVTEASIIGTAEYVTLYAHWTAVKDNTKYTIKYNLNGGKNASNPTSYTADTNTITLKNPTKTGYTFAGWYSDSKLTKKVTQIKKGSKGNITLYAKWTANKYTIKFNKNGGKGTVKAVSATYDKKVRLTKNSFTRKGYKFTGWSTKKTGKVAYKNRAYVKNLTTKKNGSVTLYAQWKAEEYNIKYNLNGGKNNAKNPKKYTVAKAVKLKAPTKKGYKFAGWYTDKKLTKKVTQIKKGSTGKVTLYAKWTKTNKK